MAQIYLLILMCVAYVALSIWIRKRHREIGYAPSESTKKAIWLAIFWIQAPLLPIFIAPIFIQQEVFFVKDSLVSFFTLVFGFIFAWAWWSINVSLWRRWAKRNGINQSELQCEGESSSILWPSGHFFERTEFDNLFKKTRKSLTSQSSKVPPTAARDVKSCAFAAPY